MGQRPYETNAIYTTPSTGTGGVKCTTESKKLIVIALFAAYLFNTITIK